jgi:WD40 repeat protein/tetratricopeptide (TPR) repeat protein
MPEVLIGPYEILDEIGRGGMGVVFKARHVHLNRVVALKMIVGGTRLSDAHLERFHMEAEAVAKLHHENIVQVYDVGEHNDAPYIALELVDGGSLARKIDGKPQGPNFAAQTVETLARAVQVAHAAGVVHRDLKPGNVLLTLDGQPKVTDFGLAKHLSGHEDGEEHTHAGSILGTPSYMAPEQAAGRVHDIGPPSDIYALGCILYECLTGHPPFRGDTPIATIRLVLEGEVVPPRRLITTVPRDLDTICLKALQKPTHRRYQTAEEMAEDLRRFLDGEPVKARPIGRAERFAKWVRRNPARAATLGTGIAALVAMLALGVWSYVAVTRRAELAEKAQKQAHEALDEGTRRLVRLNVSNGSRLLDDHDYLGAVLWYAEALRLEADGPDRERMHRVRLKAVTDRCPRPAQVWLHEAALTDAGFDAAGKAVITAGDDGTARVWDTATGAPVGPPLEHGGPVKLAALAPDGRTAATAGADGSLKVWDVKGGRAAFAVAVSVQITGLAFTPDGTRIAATGAGGRARVWDPATGHEVSTAQAGTDRACGPSFSPDGTRYVIGTRDGVARAFETATGQPVGPSLKSSGPVLAVTFAPGGKRVATAAADGTAQVWDPATGQPLLANPPRHADAVTAVRFGPDGKRLLTASSDRTAQVWDADTGLPVGRPVQHAGAVLTAEFSPDGRFFLTAGEDNTVRVWDAATGHPATPPFRSNAIPVAAAFSPNGYQVLVAAQNRIARLWDLVTPADSDTPVPAGPTAPDGGNGGVHSVFSPGRELLVSLGSGQAVRVRRAADHEPVTPPLRTGAAVTAAGFNPDGSRLATGDRDGNVMVWDARDGKPLWDKSGRHASRVLRVVFAPFGDVLATGSDDNTVGVWDAATGRAKVPPIRVGASVHRVEFGLGGAVLFTPLPDGTARVWDAATGEPLTPAVPARGDWQVALAPDPRPAETLGAIGRVFAGQQLDAAGGLVPSDSAALRDEWARLKAATPDDFAAPPPAVTAWRKRQAADAEAAGQWFAAAWHLDRLIAAGPDDADTRRRRATAAAKLGDWQRAADDAGRAVRAQPTNPDNWYQRGVALGQLGKWDRAAADLAQAVRLKSDPAAAIGLGAKVRLDAGDLPGYRQACRELVDASGEEPRAALLAAWACVLSPESGVDPARVLKLAAAGNGSADAYAATVYAAALLRASRAEEAAAKLKTLASADEDRPAAWLFYAAALAKQGQVAETKPWRAKAEAWLAKVSQPGAVPPSWDQRAEVEALLREVR